MREEKVISTTYLVKEEIENFCKRNKVEEDFITSTNQKGKYVYSTKTVREGKVADFGNFLGVEYEDGTFSVSGGLIDKMCTKSEMLDLVINN